MEFVGEAVAERVHSFQQNVYEFLYVASHVSHLHILYDYVRLKVTDVLRRKSGNERAEQMNSRNFGLTHTLSKSDDQTVWDLRHVGCLMEMPDNHVVFRCSLLVTRTRIKESIEEVSPKNVYSISLNKISQLEQEVEELKRKLATILSTNGNTIPEVKVATESKTSLMVPHPPPPPPLPPSITDHNPMDSIKKHILKNKSNLSRVPECSAAETPLMSLGEIIKSAKGVKLKHVARSPGGTPLRRPPLSSPNDLHALLTEAMKRRFNLIYPDASSQDKPDEQWSPSPIRTNVARKRSQSNLSLLQDTAC